MDNEFGAAGHEVVRLQVDGFVGREGVSGEQKGI
jgi:hypothetical protein